MLILSDVYRDARVARSAKAAGAQGHVTVLGVVRTGAMHTEGPLVDSPDCSVHLSKIWSKRIWPGKVRSAVGYLETLARLGALCLRQRPDLVYAHEVWTLPIAMFMRICLGTPFIYDAHEFYRDRSNVRWWMRRIIGAIEWSAFRYASGVVACSDQLARAMRDDYGCPALPVVVSNIWDPTTFAHWLGRGPLDGDGSPSLRTIAFCHNPSIQRVALYQGGVGPGRDLVTAVRAIARLPEQCGLVVIGPGREPFRGELRREAAGLGIAHRVTVLDPVHPLRVAQMMPEADVGIASYEPTSRNNMNCNPNKLSEYAIAGIPIVGTDQRAIREFVTLHANGVTYRPGDVESCAEALRLALVHQPTAAALQRRARLASSRVSWEPERVKLAAVCALALRRAS